AVFSGDGKIVAFTSAATDLVTGDTNNSDDVFVRDLAAHTTTRVSVASDGSERPGHSGTNGANTSTSMIPGPNMSLNQDGSIVAFSSQAAFDLADTNSQSDIYVRNRTLNQTSLVSVSSSNAAANGASGDPRLTPDGRYVIFTSAASNLVPG